MTNPYENAINTCVQMAYAQHNMSFKQLNDPLIDNVSRILANASAVTGTPLEDLIEMVRHQLDERATYHAHQIRTR